VLDRGRLDDLLLMAALEHSSAIVIVQDGAIVAEAYHGKPSGPLIAMSASKSVVSLAVGALVADGKLTLDTELASVLPEWRGARLTVRALLTHTSGLDPARANFKSTGIVENALASKQLFAPGARFQYNNNAVDLLAAVVGRVAGMPLDEYLEERLFKKLDIIGAYWLKDTHGVPRGAGELYIRPVDLAKLGQLMLDGGAWKGEQLLPRDWIDQSVAAGQSITEDCGLLWWREGRFAEVMTDSVLDAWREAGVAAPELALARPLVGKKFGETSELYRALEGALGAAWPRVQALLHKGNHVPTSYRVADGAVKGFSARGWLGQTLVVYPKARLVGVRMRAPDDADYQGGDEKDAYNSFADDVCRLSADCADRN
jgi:CubicO group peptidase (beta-lactamase class C family)